LATTAQPTTSGSQPDPQAPTLLDYPDNRLLIDLCGAFDCNLAEVEQAFAVQIVRRGNELALTGEAAARQKASDALNSIYARLQSGRDLEPGDVTAAIRFGDARAAKTPAKDKSGEPLRRDRFEIKTQKKSVQPRTPAQANYLRALFDHELVFGLGPAGTGKTYLAVAVAVSMFLDGHVDRIILSRPAVEAGERLGFLPGDMKDKIDPYMQPLYDALNDFLPAKQLGRLIEEKRIEIAPLAFMRGRTLSNAYVVLDEAQNATQVQMKMFLTRLGEGSRMAITGDMTQVDLPRGVTSGLIEAERILRDVKGIGFTRFKASDVVRHPMVARIIEAYESIGARDA